MSTNWGLKCVDCDVESGHWLNHGEDALTEVVRLWPQIGAIRSQARWVEVTTITGYTSDIFEFMDAHGEHRLVLKNEYGGEKQLWWSEGG